MRWARHIARIGERRGLYRLLVKKPEGKKPLRRPRHRWEANIKRYIQKVGFGGVDWIELVQDREIWRTHLNAVMNFRFFIKRGKFLD